MNNKTMETLKQTIKRLATLQSSLKNQRKTVKISGNRIMSAYEAANAHRSNRDMLRHMHIAYACLRNRVVADSLKGYSQGLVDKYIEQYKDNIK